MATSTWCLRSQFSGSAMLPMPRSFSIFSQPSSVTVMARAFSSTTKSPDQVFGFEGLDQLAGFEVGDDEVDARVLVGGLVGGAGDDERGAGLVDEDGVDFVDDAEVVAALDHVLEVELHVVAQVVEAELVVGAVGDVGGVGLAALGIIQIMNNYPHRKAEEAVDLAHPLGVALGEVVVDGDDVDAVAGERVEVAGKGGDEGLAFAGLHLGDLALVEDHAADELDVEVAHLHGAAGRPRGRRRRPREGPRRGRPSRRRGCARRRLRRRDRSFRRRRTSAMRWRNSPVLARNCSSESA